MNRRTSARDRVLAALKAAGDDGVLTGALCQPEVGGERFGGRIRELRQAGHNIVQRRERAGSHRYWLVDGVVAGPAAVTSPVAGEGLRAAGGTSHQTVRDPLWGWRRSYWCERCCDMKAEGPVCARGHETREGWLLDLTDQRVLYEIEDCIAEQDAALPVAA